MRIIGMLFAFLLLLTVSLNAADTKISELTALTEATIASDDELVIVDTSATATKRITLTEFDKRYSSKDLDPAQILVGNASSAGTAVDVSGDIAISNAGVVSLTAGAIVNADVNASAAIAYSKLAALASGNILVGSAGNAAASVNPSGDVDISNAGVFSIASGVIVAADVSSGAAIEYSKMEALTASKALVSDANGEPSASAVTATELGYVDGVTSAIQTQLDTKPTKVGGSDSLQTIGMLRATYDFSEDGGTSGDIGLGQTFPDNAVIKYCDIEILTSMASSGGTGTIAIKAENANDILNAVDADTLSGFNAGIPNWTVSNFKKTSAAREITATIGTEDLTAGKFIVNCLYSVSE